MRRLRLGASNGIAGLLLAGAGAIAAYYAAQLPFGSVSQPDAGFFPLSIAGLIVIFALAVIIPRLNGDADEQAASPPILRAMILSASLVVYALLLKPVGFLICTSLLIAMMLHYTGAIRWRIALPAALASSFACYLMFTQLGVPLPAGVASL